MKKTNNNTREIINESKRTTEDSQKDQSNSNISKQPPQSPQSDKLATEGGKETSVKEQVVRVKDDKHYNESSRLQEIFKLYTTLEERQVGEEFQDDDEEDDELDKIVFQNTQQGVIDQSRSFSLAALTGMKQLEKIWRFLISRLFKVNNVLLDHQGVTPLMYQMVILFEFLQTLYYIFYKVDIYNEFKTISQVLDQEIQIQKESFVLNQTIGEEIKNVNNQTVSYDKFQFYQYFIFANFHLYATQQDAFLALYFVLNGLFLTFLVTIYALSDQLHFAFKDAHMKDWQRFIVQVISYLMVIYLYIMQVPMVSVNLQGYMCGQGILADIQCGSSLNSAMIGISSASLIAYLWFLFVQRQLYTSNMFESVLPWASLERHITQFLIVQRLVLSFSNIFDPQGSIRYQINLALFFLTVLISYQRLRQALIFNIALHRATAMYESLTPWLYLCVALHQLTDNPLTVTTLSIMLVTGIILCGSVLLSTEYFRKQRFWDICESHKLLGLTQSQTVSLDPETLERFLYEMTKIIAESDRISWKDSMIKGMIIQHLQKCIYSDCKCTDLLLPSLTQDYQYLVSMDEDGMTNQQRLMYKKKKSDRMTLMDIDTQSNFNGGPGLQRQQTIGRKSNYKMEMLKSNINQDHQVSKNQSPKSKKQKTAKDISISSSFIRPVSTSRKTQHYEYHNSMIQIDNVDVDEKDQSPVGARLSKIEQDFINRASKKPTKHMKKNHKHKTANENFLGYSLQQTAISRSTSFVSQISEDKTQEQAAVQAKLDPIQLKEDERTMKYHFLSLFLDKAISLFPNSVELRIHSSYMQSQKNKNEFRGQFELMKAELYNPSMRNRFYIFRRRVIIEKILVQKNEKNAESLDKIDPKKMYQSEMLFQRYVKLEYFAANSALFFWRELLQKTVETNNLVKRGSEITQCYTLIQDVAKEITSLFPSEMKFLYRYANFLKMIVNNDFEAQQVFEKAAALYSVLVNQRQKISFYGHTSSEDIIFGENTATAIVIISLKAEEVGRIMHSNEEVYRVLGFKRKDMIGKKVNIVNPTPIAAVHDNFLRKFLDTAKRNVIDNVRQVPAIDCEGYIRPIHICVKLYPHISDRISVVGCLQSIAKLDGFEPDKLTGIPYTHFSQVTHHYILTDQYYGIACISEKLASEVGLNAKFFIQSDIFHQAINLEKLFGAEIIAPENQKDLESKGIEMDLDLRNILDHVNLEILTADEINDVKSRLGIYPVHVQLKTLVFDPKYCTIKLYRLILLPHVLDPFSTDSLQEDESMSQFGTNFKMATSSNSVAVQNQNIMRGVNFEIHEIEEENDEQSISSAVDEDGASKQQNNDDGEQPSKQEGYSYGGIASISSLGSTSTAREAAFNRAIQEYKQAFDRRETPQYLNRLGHFMAIIIVALVVLSSVEYKVKESFIDQGGNLGDQLVMSEKRTIKLIEMAIHVRSFINVANDIEFQAYADSTRIDRFMYLRSLIQSEARVLQNTHNFLITQAQKTGLLAEQENEFLDLYRLTDHGELAKLSLPYKVAINTYLNHLLQLNVVGEDELKMNDWILKASPFSKKQDLTLLEKDIYFLLVNGLRALLTKTMENSLLMHTKVEEYVQHSNISYLIVIMIGGILLSIIFALLAIKQVLQTLYSKSDIMQIFTVMSIDQIKRMFDLCDLYLEQFDQGTQIFEKLKEPPHPINATNASNQSNGANLAIAKQMETDMDARKSRQNIMNFTPEDHYGDLLKKTIFVLTSSRQSQNDIIALKNNIGKGSMNQIESSTHSLFKQIKKGGFASTMNIVPQKVQNLNPKFAFSSKLPIISQQKQHKSMNKSTGGLPNLLSPSQFQIKPKPTPPNIEPKIKKQQPNQKQSSVQSLVRLRGIKREKLTLEEEKKSSSSSSSESEDPKQVNLQEDEKEIAATQKREFNTSVDHDERQILWRRITNIIITCIILGGYFGYGFGLYKGQLDELSSIHDSTPVFFKRYSTLLLSYTYLRERFITLNRYTTAELGFFVPSTETVYHASIDDHYHISSMLFERELAKLLLKRPSGLDKLTSHFKLVDSKQYCNTLNQLVQASQDSSLVSYNAIQLQDIRHAAYKKEIDTVIAACNFAAQGNIDGLRSLVNVDLSQGDYDRRTPLHVAVANRHLDVVRFLVEVGKVNINPIDRWGATPLSDSLQSAEIKSYLESKGALLGKILPYKRISTSFSLDMFKVLYAAYYGDLTTLDALRQAGVDLNGFDYDGRTALHLAASEGNLETVQYLASHISNITVQDSRGNDALADAIRENQTDVINYLVELDSRYQNSSCQTFENGLFLKGMQQSIGIFLKKFADLQILLSSTSNYTQTVQTQAGPYQTFFSAHEKYLYKTINTLIDIIEVNTSQFWQSYISQLELSFYIYLGFLIFTLLVLRRMLIRELTREVMRTRGILNMVPLSFFVEEPEAAQRVVEMMKKDR